MTPERPNVSSTSYYGPTAAAKLLGVSLSTLYRLRDRGCLRFNVRRAGSRPVISGAQLLRCWANII